jgi:Immunity protein 63
MSPVPAASLQTLESRVFELAATINAPKGMLPTFGSSDQTGRPSIELRSGVIIYAERERGHLVRDRVPDSEDDLLYWVFRSVTFSMAREWELRHRIQGQDPRRQLFIRQLELLARLDPRWASRLHKDDAIFLAEVDLA